MNNPFVSIVYVVRDNPIWFSKSIDSIIATSSKEDVEILLKIDSDENPTSYIDILSKSGLNYKILIYDRMKGASDVHLFDLDLCKIASGEFMWLCGDDIIMYTNNWVDELRKAYDIFKDHILVCAFQSKKTNKYGRDKSTLGNKTPIITKSWFKCKEYLFPNWTGDKYLYSIGRSVKRYLYLQKVAVGINLSKRKKQVRAERLSSSMIWEEDRKSHINSLKLYMVDHPINLPEGILFA